MHTFSSLLLILSFVKRPFLTQPLIFCFVPMFEQTLFFLLLFFHVVVVDDVMHGAVLNQDVIVCLGQKQYFGETQRYAGCKLTTNDSCLLFN